MEKISLGLIIQIALLVLLLLLKIVSYIAKKRRKRNQLISMYMGAAQPKKEKDPELELQPGLSLDEAMAQLFEKKGLSSYKNGILYTKMNSVCIWTKSADVVPGTGESKLGGEPDLPPGVKWPFWGPDPSIDQRHAKEWIRQVKEHNKHELSIKHKLSIPENPIGRPLSFVAQINLADVFPHDLERLLPASGMLYFFYEGDVMPGLCAPDHPGSYKVLYYNGSTTGLRPVKPPDNLDDWGKYKPRALSFQHEVSLPDNDSGFLDMWGMSDEQKFSYSDIVETLQEAGLVNEAAGEAMKDPYADVHRMLGYPDPEQGHVFLACEAGYSGRSWDDPKVIEASTHWRLLLQVDSLQGAASNGMSWGDVGHLYFCIRDSDLKARDFSKVWMIAQCG